MNKYSKKNGFTLVELILVILILGILAAMILPHFINLSKRAELSTAQHFEGVLKEAHESYYLRLVLENNPNIDPVGSSSSFYNFVAFSDSSGSDRNTVVVGSDFRYLFQNPSGDVYQPDGTILFTFKSGATATYYISSIGAISAEYTAF